MFKIYGGGTAFRQWEQGYVLTNDCMNVGDEVVFRNSTGKTIPVNAREDGGAVVVDVPNELLMDCSNIVVELGQGSERHHECFTTFEVERCDKPSGYVCKPNEYRAPTNAPDWNQNNPSGAGYVKNRTHWVEIGHAIFAQDVTEDFSAGNAVPLRAELELVAGRTYEVIWDGTLYSCVAYLLEFEGQSFTVLGNASVGNPTFSGGNGEPFLLNAVPEMTLVFAQVPGKHTFTISGETEIIHGLDAKYIDLTSPNGTKFTLIVDDDGYVYGYNPDLGGPV